MGLLSWLPGLSRRSATPQPRPFEEVIAAIDGAFAGASSTGAAISASTALQVSTVLACVRAIADGCATPQLHVYREKADGRRELATNIPEYRILSRRPNEWQTSFEFRRTLTMHAVLTGNALAFKVKSGNRVRELIPIVPGNYVIEHRSRYDVAYHLHDQFGSIGTFGVEDVLHLPSWQWEWIKGLSAVHLAREAIGLSMAAEQNQGALHRNGGRPGGILTTSLTQSPESVARLREAWKQYQSTNRNGVAVLDGGWDFKPLAMNGVDSQHLETRRFQVEEICRAFGVFPIIVGHSDKSATFASSEAFFTAHVRQTLMPWQELWRQRIDEFVLDGSGPLFVEFDNRYLLAGSMADRAQWARTMVELGIYTRNEIRDEEGKDPLPGLDDPLTPLNMTQGAKPAADTPDDGSADEPDDDDTGETDDVPTA
jgi:HK97 family phage portal protein